MIATRRSLAVALLVPYTAWWPSSWWNSAVALGTVIDHTARTGDPAYLWTVRRTFDVNRAAFPPGARSSDPIDGHFISRSIDDSAWWALTWIAGRLRPDPRPGLPGRGVDQTDGNLVLYDGAPGPNPIWATGTWNLPTDRRPTHADMQADGNFVLYNDAMQPAWAAGVFGSFGNPYLEVQSDSNLVIYHNGRTPIWANGTQR